MSAPPRVVVLTVSDRCARGAAVDTSGPALCEMVKTRLGAEIVHTACLPDEIEVLADFFRTWSEPPRAVDLLLSTGGTGLAPRDITPEALRRVLEREHAGLMELARLRCYTKTPRTYLSRGIAGTIGRTLILTLPGSPRGSCEMLEAVLDILLHAIETLRGEVQDDGRPNLTPGTGERGRIVRHED